MAQKRIALVRGSTIGRGEVSWWNKRLSEFGYHVTGFASKRISLTEAEIGEPVRRFWSLSDLPRIAPRKIDHAVEKLLARAAVGFFDRLVGLERSLRDYDIINTSETYRGYSAQCARARLTYQKRLVVHVFENIPFCFDDHPRLRHNRQLTVQAADLYVAATERAAEALLVEGVEPTKIRVIYPGINISNFTKADTETRLALRRKYGYLSTDVLILFVGRLRRVKGTRELLYAVETLLGRRPDLIGSLRLLIVGQGPEAESIEQFTKEKGLEECVQLLGFQASDSLAELYRLADLFVLPSGIRDMWQEQYGKALVEAMASGLPVITTHSGSIDEVVGDTALLVPPNDFFRLSQSIERLVDYPGLARELGRRGRERAVEHFDHRDYLPQIADALDEML